MDIDLRQFGDTPAVTREDWEAAVAKALGTLTLDKISAITKDGIAVPPLAPLRTDRDPLPGRGAGVPWSIVQRVTLTDDAPTNETILTELQSGATAIDLVIPTGTLAVSSGRTKSEEDHRKLDRVFEGVYLDMISVHFTTSSSDLVSGLRLIEAMQPRMSDIASNCLHLGIDPFAVIEAGYADSLSQPYDLHALNDICKLRAQYSVSGTVLTSRGQVWHAIGASEAQQIAMALATGIAYLRHGAEQAASADLLEQLSRSIEFRLVADQNQFLTTAKLRAFRRLWALVLEEFGLPQAPAFVHAETAWKMTTRRDPWVNIVRSTIAAFAAAVGGADAITTQPHSDLLGVPDGAARRLARNVQSILLEESNLHRVADPAAGAAGIEALTDSLAEKAWDELRAIEREGGLQRSLADGGLRARIAAVEKTTRDRIVKRRIPITGSSTYPMLDETLPAVAGPHPVPPAPPHAPLSQPSRDAEPWEALRDRSDAILAATGRRPKMFLANLGPVSSFTARATWAKNLFEAGGIEAVARDGHVAIDTLAASFRDSGARFACLCSNDATYETLGRAAAEALKAAGAERVLVAGKPGAVQEALTAGGADQFVHEGLDMVALLGELHDRLGASAA